MKKLFKIFAYAAIYLAALILVYDKFHKFSKFQTLKNIGNIERALKESVNDCGKGYYASWIVLDKTKYFFQNVYGCQGKSKNCAYSVKEAKLNQFYLDDHFLSGKDLQELKNKPSGEPAYYDSSVLEKYPTIFEITKNSNHQINELGLVVLKNFKNDLIYIFTIANTSKSNVCGRQEITARLEKIISSTGDSNQ
jgi:hypothetical protein